MAPVEFGIAGVVDRKEQGGTEILGVDKGAVEGDGQGFFAYPGAAQALHGFGRGRDGGIGSQLEGSLNSGGSFFAPGVAEEEELGQADGGGQVGAAQEGGDQAGKNPAER